jgi:hypothetical protein
MFLCVSKAAIASSFFRPNLVPWPATICPHLHPSGNQRSCIARRSPGLISLAFQRLPSDRCCHAAITAKGENMKSTTEQTETAPTAVTPETKAAKKASADARRATVAPAKTKAGKKAAPKNKAPKSARNDAREQQNRHDPHPAEAAGRSDRQRTA